MNVLLAEDDRVVRITVRDALQDAGYRVSDCADGLAALHAFESSPFDLVLSDVRLPGLDGLSLFRRLRELRPDVAVLFMTAYADFRDAVDVMRDGARDYIVKPFDMDELLLRLARVKQEIGFRTDMQRTVPSSTPGTRTFLGTSAAAQKMLERIDAAAASDVSVLILGETGTGKDLCAQMIHERSARANKSFVVVNCAAIPESLLESELFGHEKGAFTGAVAKRIGRFEAADGGTLVLDEVGELPIAQQAKLLRVLETGTFEPVGSSRSVTVNARVISSTNRNLPDAVAQKTFRSDLFYRLNVIDIHAPALRERRSDIPLMVREFLNEICTRQGVPIPALHPCVLAILATYDFPGNVRELLHALERSVALSRGGPIRLEHLPDAMTSAGCDCPEALQASPCSERVDALEDAVGKFEHQYIQRVLSKVDGHRGRAASMLGISRKSLWLRLKETSEDQ